MRLSIKIKEQKRRKMKITNRTLIESGFAVLLILILASFVSAAEYSGEVSNDFIIASEKASIIKPAESAYNPNYLIAVLIILILAIAILVFKKKKGKKKTKKR